MHYKLQIKIPFTHYWLKTLVGTVVLAVATAVVPYKVFARLPS